MTVLGWLKAMMGMELAERRKRACASAERVGRRGGDWCAGQGQLRMLCGRRGSRPSGLVGLRAGAWQSGATSRAVAAARWGVLGFAGPDDDACVQSRANKAVPCLRVQVLAEEV